MAFTSGVTARFLIGFAQVSKIGLGQLPVCDDRRIAEAGGVDRMKMTLHTPASGSPSYNLNLTRQVNDYAVELL